MKREWTIFGGLLSIFLLAYFLNFTDANIQRAIVDAFYMLQWYARIPEEAVARWVGGDSFTANMVASVIGAMWYFATLTEIPILETLIGLGMGRGPALSLLLAGPALSLPSIAVIYSVIGFKKTAVFVALVVVMSAVVGMVFGWFFV